LEQELSASQVYETQKLVEEYLLFHYGSDEEILPWASGPNAALGFPVRTVAHFSEDQVTRALDIGCAVGRSTLEMSKNADSVIGIDFSQAFVDAAAQVSQGEEVSYHRHEEASQATQLIARKPADTPVGKVSFEAGDAMNLRADLGSLDFELTKTADEPFLIRETARKFQWTVSMVTTWRRR